jgi:hypothetical protein
VVEGDRAAAEEDEGEGEGGQSQGGFVSADQTAMNVEFGDGDGQIDTNGERSDASEQAEKDEQRAEEFGEGGDVGGPGRESEAGDKLSMVVKSAEDLVVSVDEHDGAEGEAHDEKREGLQTVEVAHVVPPAEMKIAYSRLAIDGSGEGMKLGFEGGRGKSEALFRVL